MKDSVFCEENKTNQIDVDIKLLKITNKRIRDYSTPGVLSLISRNYLLSIIIVALWAVN